MWPHTAATPGLLNPAVPLGRANTQGADTLAALVRRGHGRITVLAGGGVTPGNTGELVRRCGLQELHSTAKR